MSKDEKKQVKKTKEKKEHPWVPLAKAGTGLTKKTLDDIQYRPLRDHLHVKELGGGGHCFFYVLAYAVNQRAGTEKKQRVTQQTVRSWFSDFIFQHEGDRFEFFKNVREREKERGDTLGTYLDARWTLKDVEDEDEVPEIHTLWQQYRAAIKADERAAAKAAVVAELNGTCEADDALYVIATQVLREHTDVKASALVILRVLDLARPGEKKRKQSVYAQWYPEPPPTKRSTEFLMIWNYAEKLGARARAGHYRLLSWKANSKSKEQVWFKGFGGVPEPIKKLRADYDPEQTESEDEEEEPKKKDIIDLSTDSDEEGDTKQFLLGELRDEAKMHVLGGKPQYQKMVDEMFRVLDSKQLTLGDLRKENKDKWPVNFLAKVMERYESRGKKRAGGGASAVAVVAPIRNGPWHQLYFAMGRFRQ